MMKRKIVCKTCRTSKNSATGQPLYILGDSITLTTQSRLGECMDCGDARRAAEEAKKQARLERMFGDAD